MSSSIENQLPRILILGAASAWIGQAVELAEESGYRVGAVVDNLGSPLDLDLGDVPLHFLKALPDALRELPAVCCVGTPDYRRLIVRQAVEVGITCYVTLAHPRAYVSRSARAGIGSILSPQASLGAGARLGDHVQIRASAVVGHDTIIGDYVTVAPGAVVGGLVQIEDGVSIGLGARILPRLRIGANAAIAAGAVVTADVPASTVVAGAPATTKQESILSYRG